MSRRAAQGSSWYSFTSQRTICVVAILRALSGELANSARLMAVKTFCGLRPGDTSLFLGREDGILDLDPLLLDSVQETPGPDEFRGKQRQAEADRDPARSRGDQHHHAEKKERETYHDFEKTLHLLDGSQKHREPVPANSTVEGCINLSIYPGIRRR